MGDYKILQNQIVVLTDDLREVVVELNNTNIEVDYLKKNMISKEEIGKVYKHLKFCVVSIMAIILSMLILILFII